MRRIFTLALLCLAPGVAASADWSPDRFGPLDRPPALRPVGEPATVLTREAFLTERERAEPAALDAAWSLLDAGRLEEAGAAFTRLRRSAPADGRAAVGAALTRTLAGGDPLPAWAEVLKLEPEAIAYVNLGWDARVRVARARILLHAGLPVDPRPAEPLFLMAVCDALLRDFELAEQRLEAARGRAGAGPHLERLGALVDRLKADRIVAWEGTPPPARTPVAVASREPAARVAVTPRPRVFVVAPPEVPGEPARAPDLGALVERLREAAVAVGRFEVRLNERLYPLVVLPPEREPTE